MSCYKLLLSLVFEDSSPTKDGGNDLGGVLEGWALVLASFSTLAVFDLIIIMSWLLRGFATERYLQASALSHSVLSILMDRAWAVQQLAEVTIIGALGLSITGVD